MDRIVVSLPIWFLLHLWIVTEYAYILTRQVWAYHYIMETQPWGQERERESTGVSMWLCNRSSFVSFGCLGTYLDTYQMTTGKVLRGRFVPSFGAPYIAGRSSYNPTSDRVCWMLIMDMVYGEGDHEINCIIQLSQTLYPVSHWTSEPASLGLDLTSIQWKVNLLRVQTKTCRSSVYTLFDQASFKAILPIKTT